MYFSIGRYWFSSNRHYDTCVASSCGENYSDRSPRSSFTPMKPTSRRAESGVAPARWAPERSGADALHDIMPAGSVFLVPMWRRRTAHRLEGCNSNGTSLRDIAQIAFFRRFTRLQVQDPIAVENTNSHGL